MTLQVIETGNSKYYLDIEFRLQGKYVRYWTNPRRTRVLATYKNDILCGEFIAYFENGTLMRHSFYECGLLHGTSYSTTRSHSVPPHILYVRGKPTGVPEHMDLGELTDEDKFELILTHGYMEFI